MSVRKFKSVADMPRPPTSTNEPLHLRIAAVWERAHVRGAPSLPRGVMRYRSLDEARAARAAHTRATVTAQRATAQASRKD